MSKLKKPILLIIAILICLSMLRLAVWQLDRAEQKQTILDQLQIRASAVPVDLNRLLSELEPLAAENDRFRNVVATGTFNAENSILVDNKVLAGQIGYELYTPLKLSDGDNWVLVDRGWIEAGETRQELPEFITGEGLLTLTGRLNLPPAQPPLWDDKYPVATGKVWQYLPINEYATQMRMNLLPLVLELAPDQEAEVESALQQRWSKIDDQWVAKHKGYAFQWFAMAAAFFIACLVLLIRSK